MTGARVSWAGEACTSATFTGCDDNTKPPGYFNASMPTLLGSLCIWNVYHPYGSLCIYVHKVEAKRKRLITFSNEKIYYPNAARALFPNHIHMLHNYTKADVLGLIHHVELGFIIDFYWSVRQRTRQHIGRHVFFDILLFRNKQICM